MSDNLELLIDERNETKPVGCLCHHELANGVHQYNPLTQVFWICLHCAKHTWNPYTNSEAALAMVLLFTLFLAGPVCVIISYAGFPVLLFSRFAKNEEIIASFHVWIILTYFLFICLAGLREHAESLISPLFMDIVYGGANNFRFYQTWIFSLILILPFFG